MPKVSKTGKQSVVTTKPKIGKAGAKVNAGKKLPKGDNPVALKPQPDKDKVELSKKEKVDRNPTAKKLVTKKPVTEKSAPKEAKKTKTGAKGVQKASAGTAPSGAPVVSKVAPTNLPTVASMDLPVPIDMPTLPPGSSGNGVTVGVPRGEKDFNRLTDVHGRTIDPMGGAKVLPPAPQRLFPQAPPPIEDGIVLGMSPKVDGRIEAALNEADKNLNMLEDVLKPKTFAQVATGEVDCVSVAAKKLVMIVNESTTLKSVARTVQSVVTEGRGLVRAIVGVNRATTNAGRNLAKGAIRALFRR